MSLQMVKYELNMCMSYCGFERTQIKNGDSGRDGKEARHKHMIWEWETKEINCKYILC